MIDDGLFANWLSTIPNYGKMPLYCMKLKLMVSAGSYVVTYGPEGPKVSRIVDYVGDVVTVNTYDVLCSSETLSNSSSKAYGMKEIVQTRKKRMTTINDLQDLAFVFTLADVQSGRVNHCGVKNCYLIRYRSCNSELEDIGYTYAFPCESPLHIHFRTSTSQIIWNGIMTIQDLLWKILNTESQKQITYSEKMPAFIDTALWDYLLYRCSNVVKSRLPPGVRGKIRSSTSYGLNRSSMKVEKNCTLLRFQTKEQLKLLREIFGDFCTLGCRRRRPKLGVIEKVEFYNKLNIVLGAEEEEYPFRSRSYLSCVDIAKDEFGSYIQVVYDSYLYTRKGIINYCDEDVSKDSYVVDMFKSMRQSTAVIDDIVGVGCMVRRENGTELLKIIKISSKSVSLEYILPASRYGEIVIEDDIPKIREEIKALCR